MSASPPARRGTFFLRYALWPLLAAAIGAGQFIFVQHVTGAPQDIAQFMGAQIVRRGGYAEGLAGVVGWSVHLGVALGYACLYALITMNPYFPSRRVVRWSGGLVVALLLGWVTTLVTAPAITVTINLLAGSGFPESVPGLNTAFGVPFWNHLGFFVIAWLVTVVARDRVPVVG